MSERPHWRPQDAAASAGADKAPNAAAGDPGARQERSDAPLDQDALELAALYALTALSGAEMEAVEREQRDNPAFWAEVRSLCDAAAGLAESGPRGKPKRDLWPEIRARVRSRPPATASCAAQVWKQWRSEPGETPADLVVPARSTPFEPTDIDGIRVRRLSVDAAAERVTMLVRMDAGTAYPGHRHGGVEECLVLEGDLVIGPATPAGKTVELHAGDYQRMGEGSVHALQSTRGGCLLLITSSQHDELVG